MHVSAGLRQTLMFSATFPKEIQELAADFMSNYLFLAVGRVGSSTNLIIQHFEEVEPGDKQKLLVSLVRAVPVSYMALNCCCCCLPVSPVSHPRHPRCASELHVLKLLLPALVNLSLMHGMHAILPCLR